MSQKLLFILLGLHFFALAHAHNGTIEGQILEKGSGLELPGATIRLEPGGQYANANALGLFRFANLSAGVYTISVKHIGYENQTVENITVRDAETTTLKIELQISTLNLQDVEIKTSTAQPFQSISALDLRTRPLNSTQDILRTVPGLFIAQHAGGGKAEQIFLRGFDLDHGTDINLSVDGMPVNMVSHAHGQGYADLHFVIPELIDQVEFKKGPYDADAGNFSTAGTVRFQTSDQLEHSFLKLEGGQFHTARAVGAFQLLGSEAGRRNRSAYIASEACFSDGYFDHPQGFNRLNLFGKYRAMIDDEQRIGISASLFRSNWDASGQIPERAVTAGLIDRFGSIDSTEGGITSRYNFNVEHIKSLGDKGLFKNRLYYTLYNFELYSDFTFFREDPVNGDEIRQKEHRNLFGYEGSYHVSGNLLHQNLETEIGWFLREDQTGNTELSRVRQRETLTARLALGDIDETNAGAYVSETWHPTPRITVNAGLRADFFQNRYDNKLDSVYAPGHVSAGILSPKLKIFFDASKRLRLYLNGGFGYHSNDTRVVVAQNGRDILPRAKGADLGALFKPSPALLFNIAAWALALDQEFVYVGDEAVVEVGGKTLRYGADVSLRAQVFRHLFADADLTYSHARSTEDPEGANFIPLAPRWTATGGLAWEQERGFFGSLRFRHLGDRAANEDNSLIANGYFLLDAVAGWKKGSLEFGLNGQNLLNAAWKEAQFETESRLKNELESVTEIHFTPGTPLFIKGYVVIGF